MAAYTDYEFYTDTYGGAAISESDWPRISCKAQAEVDHVTFGRIANMATVPECVKECICDIAERMQKAEQIAAGGSIASEQNDGYSISYRDDGGEAGRQSEIHLAIASHLARTGLMYRGVLENDKFLI